MLTSRRNVDVWLLSFKSIFFFVSTGFRLVAVAVRCQQKLSFVRIFFGPFFRVFVLIPHIYTVPSQSGQYNQQSRTPNNFSLFISVSNHIDAIFFSHSCLFRLHNNSRAFVSCYIQVLKKYFFFVSSVYVLKMTVRLCGFKHHKNRGRKT